VLLASYAPAYCGQVMDDAVRAMSHALNEYEASPLRTEICKPTTLLLGFDTADKITAIGVGGMAGD
jgi:hypothetical protein